MRAEMTNDLIIAQPALSQLLKTLEAGYNAEIKVLEPRLAIRPEAFQAILDDVAPIDIRAKKIKPADFIDSRFLDDITRSAVSLTNSGA
jgi:hypothetical protein